MKISFLRGTAALFTLAVFSAWRIAAAPATQPATKSATLPVTQLATRPAAQLTTRPAAQVATRPAAQLATRPVTQLAKRSVTQLATRSVTQLAKRPAVQLATQLATQPATRPATVRCAVIGGMEDTGFWTAIAERFEQETAIHIDLIASGPKEGIDKVFRQGGIDLITMHASDTIINLVADGLAADPQVWLRNDLVIVGPVNDPAAIKGDSDAQHALRKIADAKANFVVHSSLGAQEVLHAILESGDITLDPDHTKVLFDDKQRRVLSIAAHDKAYTLVGRIPFRSGKIPNDGMVVMVEGDPRLRRPFVVAVADPARVAGVHVREARRLVAFLRSDKTQAWIATFGKGKLDANPLFFPALPSLPATRPAEARLTIGGEVPHPLSLDAAAIASMPHQNVKVKDRDGNDVVYAGVPLASLLTDAGLAVGENKMRGDPLSLCLVVEAADGYRVVFSLAELDGAGGKSIVLADQREGRALPSNEGPYRVIVGKEPRPNRWVRQVSSLKVARP